MKSVEQIVLIALISPLFLIYFNPIVVLIPVPIYALVYQICIKVLLKNEINHINKKIFPIIYFILILIIGYKIHNASIVSDMVRSFFIAVICGHFFNYLINRIMWGSMPRHVFEHKEQYSFVNLLGVAEIILYMIAICNNQGEFVAFWVGTKIAVTWKNFSKEAQGGMSSHHIFLIGNALNILWACIGVFFGFDVQIIK